MVCDSKVLTVTQLDFTVAAPWGPFWLWYCTCSSLSTLLHAGYGFGELKS
jgi:hypothetical protein